LKKPSKTRYPLESFDPRFRNIWLRGILGEVRIAFDTLREAQAFQARLQIYRSKLREANDPQSAMLYRAKTSLRSNILLIHPTDTAFVSVLNEFNQPIRPSTIPSVTPTPPPTTPASSADLDESTSTPLSLEELFAELPPPTEEPTP
jgi:hypothetical protein